MQAPAVQSPRPAPRAAGIDVQRVDGKADLRAFVDLPYRLHIDDPHWTPPLRLDVTKRLSRKHLHTRRLGRAAPRSSHKRVPVACPSKRRLLHRPKLLGRTVRKAPLSRNPTSGCSQVSLSHSRSTRLSRRCKAFQGSRKQRCWATMLSWASRRRSRRRNARSLPY